MLESAFLLFSLNEYLSRTAVMVQPLNLPEGSDVASLSAVQIPLPPLSKGSMLQGRQTSPSFWNTVGHMRRLCIDMSNIFVCDGMQ